MNEYPRNLSKKMLIVIFLDDVTKDRGEVVIKLIEAKKKTIRFVAETVEHKTKKKFFYIIYQHSDSV